MKKILFILFLPITLMAFETHPVTPFPVLGYREISFKDENFQIDRAMLIWYPIEQQISGTPSKSPWDLFNIAIDAVPLSSNGKMPVIVISHGYTGNPHQLSWLIRGLVCNGYIVLGIQHVDLIEGKVHINHWRRAQDIQNLITQFSADSMVHAADMNKVGVAGYSLGGTTAIWLEGGRSNKLSTLLPELKFASPKDFERIDEALPTLNKEMMAEDWRDARIKAAFVIAPAWAWLFDEVSLEKISIPTYIIATENDKVLVTRNNAGFFATHIPKAFYQAIPGDADHYIFISALNSKQRQEADPTGALRFIFEDPPTVDRQWIQERVSEEATNFFDAFLK